MGILFLYFNTLNGCCNAKCNMPCSAIVLFFAYVILAPPLDYNEERGSPHHHSFGQILTMFVKLNMAIEVAVLLLSSRWSPVC